jgi:integrase
VITSNPAKGRRRRLKTRRRSAVWIDNAEHIQALLDAAGELDKAAELNGGRRHTGAPPYRRALLATLLFAGLRVGELIALRWRDIDLAGKRIMVRPSKADDGISEVELLPVLHDELTTYKAGALRTAPEQLVFPSAAGTALSDGNIRNRVLAKAVARANETLTAQGELPLPDGLTPHKLRHTFASLLVTAGVDPGRVMDQLRHADPSFTLRVYRHAMGRDAASRKRLAALVDGTAWELADVQESLPAADVPTRQLAFSADVGLSIQADK